MVKWILRLYVGFLLGQDANITIEQSLVKIIIHFIIDLFLIDYFSESISSDLHLTLRNRE